MSKEDLIASHDRMGFIVLSPLGVAILIFIVAKVLTMLKAKKENMDIVLNPTFPAIILFLGAIPTMVLLFSTSIHWDKQFDTYVAQLPSQEYKLESVNDRILITTPEGLLFLNEKEDYNIVIQGSGEAYVNGQVIRGFEEVDKEDMLKVDSIHITLEDLENDYKSLILAKD